MPKPGISQPAKRRLGRQQIQDVDLQRIRQSLDILEGWIALLTLNEANVGTVKLSQIAEFFLRNTLRKADGAQVPSQTATSRLPMNFAPRHPVEVRGVML